jgi:hypothetical protein
MGLDVFPLLFIVYISLTQLLIITLLPGMLDMHVHNCKMILIVYSNKPKC